MVTKIPDVEDGMHEPPSEYAVSELVCVLYHRLKSGNGLQFTPLEWRLKLIKQLSKSVEYDE
jgi:hypothetical protein